MMSRNENEINALLDTILKRNDVNLMSDERCNALNTFVERIKEGISLNFPRILALIDTLSTLIQIAGANVRGAPYRTPILVLLEIMLKNGKSEQLSQLSKNLSKILNVACKILSNNDRNSIVFAVSILRIAALSPFLRPLILTQSSTVLQACLQHILPPCTTNTNSKQKESFCDLQNSLQQFQAEIFGLYSSVKSPTQWVADFQILLHESNLLLGRVGIVNSKMFTIESESSIDSKLDTVLATSVRNNVNNSFESRDTGFSKAVYLRDAYHALTCVLRQCLLCGCSSGVSLQFNMTAFVNAFTTVLGYWRNLSTHDPVNSIEADSGLSPLDVQAVMPNLKLSALLLATDLLYVQPPNLIRHGTVLHRPVAQLLTHVHKKLPANAASSRALLTAALKYTSLAAAVFPNVVAVHLNSTDPSTVVELLREAMLSLTSDRSSILTSSTTTNNDNNSNGDDFQLQLESKTYREYLSVLFQCCENILLHCGLVLSPSVLNNLETSVGLGLVTLAKGALTPQFLDRRLQRHPCEFIRCDPEIQLLLLQLATTALLASQSSKLGLLDGNMTVLIKACENCQLHPITRGQASRTLLTLHALLSPSAAVPLPAVPIADHVKVYLETTVRIKGDVPIDGDEGGLVSKINSVSQSGVGGEISEGVLGAEKNNGSDEEAGSALMSSSSNSKKRSPSESAQHDNKEQNKDALADGMAPIRRRLEESAVNSRAKEVEDDDDLDLPELDIEAEPDN